MNDLIVISPVRNERYRWLPSYLEVWDELADRILLADNGSTDGSRAYFSKYDKVEDITPPFASKKRMFGDEWKWRKYMFMKAVAESQEGDVLCWADIDMIPLEDPRPFFKPPHVEMWTSVLYDLWEEREDGTLMYRDDQWWQGHKTRRIWAVRNTQKLRDLDVEWLERGMHCQHLPVNVIRNSDEWNWMVGPTLLHYGWFGQANRERKFIIYRDLAEQGHLSRAEWEHAQTVLDEEPNLKPLPKEPQWTMGEAEEVE